MESYLLPPATTVKSVACKDGGGVLAEMFAERLWMQKATISPSLIQLEPEEHGGSGDAGVPLSSSVVG